MGLLTHAYRAPQLLLVLWKSILACCGGIRELARVKKLSRELAGLGSVPDEGEETTDMNPTPHALDLAIIAYLVSQ